MSTPKVLGAVDLSAATAANLFGPLTTGATFNVRFTNRNASDRTVTLGFSTSSATFQAARYIVKDFNVPAGETLELTGLACSTEYLVAESSGTSVNAVAYGIEV